MLLKEWLGLELRESLSLLRERLVRVHGLFYPLRDQLAPLREALRRLRNRRTVLRERLIPLRLNLLRHFASCERRA